MMHAVDWFPTLLSFAGGVPDSDLDGVDQSETITEGAKSSRNEFLYNIDNLFNRSAIRVGKYKLIKDKGEKKFRLFDLEKDPVEHTDIAEKNRDIEKELKGRLDFYRQTQFIRPVQKVDWVYRDSLNYEIITPGWC